MHRVKLLLFGKAIAASNGIHSRCAPSTNNEYFCEFANGFDKFSYKIRKFVSEFVIR